MKNLRICLFLLLLAFAAGCGRSHESGAAAGKQAADSLATAIARAVPVRVQTLTPSRFTLGVEPGGSTEAWREVDMAAQVAGTVLRLPHKLGDFVEEGDLLVEIDKRLYAAGVRQAEAGLLGAKAAREKARRDLERSKSLVEKKRISETEFEGAQLAAQQAEAGEQAAGAALDLAKKSLEDCEIRAPFAGRVALMVPEVGEQIAPGPPLVSVVDLSSVRIRTGVSERDAMRIREGMKVDVFIPALNDERFEGEVYSLGVRSDPSTRSFPLEIRLSNPGGRLLSGMSARSRILLKEKSGALVIPVSAVIEQFGEPVAFTIREGTAKRHALTLGQRSGDRVEVLGGLSAGDELVVQGQWSVKDGTTVEIVGNADMTRE